MKFDWTIKGYCDICHKEMRYLDLTGEVGPWHFNNDTTNYNEICLGKFIPHLSIEELKVIFYSKEYLAFEKIYERDEKIRLAPLTGLSIFINTLTLECCNILKNQDAV